MTSNDVGLIESSTKQEAVISSITDRMQKPKLYFSNSKFTGRFEYCCLKTRKQYCQ